MLERLGGLYFVVFISSLSMVCAIVRLVALIVYTKSPYTNWGLPVIPFVSAMEAYVALMTSSIPAIYPLIFQPKPNSRSPNPQQQQRSDEEWLRNVRPLDSSKPDMSSPNGISALGNGTPAKDRAEIGIDFSRKKRNSIYEIPSSTVSHNPSVVSSSAPSSKEVGAASAAPMER